jgi:hypothetical protein
VGDITPVKDKRKGEINKNIFAGLHSLSRRSAKKQEGTDAT